MDNIFNGEFWGWARSLAMASTPVKVLAFFTSWLILWLPVVIPLARKLNWHPRQPLTGAQKLPILASLYAIAPAIVWAATRLQGKTLADYGFKLQPQLLSSLGWGILLSLLGLSLTFFAEGFLGWISWRRDNLQRLLTLSLPIFFLSLWIGGTEELIFRGFLFSEFNQDYSFGWAALLSGLIFAASHLLWERRQTLPQLPGLFLMGLILVLARWLDGGSLGLASGLHAGWIWGLTSLDSAEILTYAEESPAWGTGIERQPLAGLAGLLCLLATGASLWILPFPFSAMP